MIRDLLYGLGVTVATIGSMGVVGALVSWTFDRVLTAGRNAGLFIEFLTWRRDQRRRNGMGPGSGSETEPRSEVGP
jgi:hypothetical protein